MTLAWAMSKPDISGVVTCKSQLQITAPIARTLNENKDPYNGGEVFVARNNILKITFLFGGQNLLYNYIIHNSELVCLNCLARY